MDAFNYKWDCLNCKDTFTARDMPAGWHRDIEWTDEGHKSCPLPLCPKCGERFICGTRIEAPEKQYHFILWRDSQGNVGNEVIDIPPEEWVINRNIEMDDKDGALYRRHCDIGGYARRALSLAFCGIDKDFVLPNITIVIERTWSITRERYEKAIKMKESLNADNNTD